VARRMPPSTAGGTPFGKCVIEGRHGSAGAPRAAPGGVGGHVGAPCGTRIAEERHGFPGARRAPGGVGGHVGAPHVTR
jgi:hypothetical protein